MPDPLELPGVGRSVVPPVCARLALVDELVAFSPGKAVVRLQLVRRATGRGPGLAAVVRSLDDLSEPRVGLAGKDAIRVDGRALQVVDLPSTEERPLDPP